MRVVLFPRPTRAERDEMCDGSALTNSTIGNRLTLHGQQLQPPFHIDATL